MKTFPEIKTMIIEVANQTGWGVYNETEDSFVLKKDGFDDFRVYLNIYSIPEYNQNIPELVIVLKCSEYAMELRQHRFNLEMLSVEFLANIFKNDLSPIMLNEVERIRQVEILKKKDEQKTKEILDLLNSKPALSNFKYPKDFKLLKEEFGDVNCVPFEFLGSLLGHGDIFAVDDEAYLGFTWLGNVRKEKLNTLIEFLSSLENIF